MDGAGTKPRRARKTRHSAVGGTWDVLALLVRGRRPLAGPELGRGRLTVGGVVFTASRPPGSTAHILSEPGWSPEMPPRCSPAGDAEDIGKRRGNHRPTAPGSRHGAYFLGIPRPRRPCGGRRGRRDRRTLFLELSWGSVRPYNVGFRRRRPELFLFPQADAYANVMRLSARRHWPSHASRRNGSHRPQNLPPG
jgi:hypothetical protein